MVWDIAKPGASFSSFPNESSAQRRVLSHHFGGELVPWNGHNSTRVLSVMSLPASPTDRTHFSWFFQWGTKRAAAHPAGGREVPLSKISLVRPEVTRSWGLKMVHTVRVLGERLSHLENVSKAQRWPPPEVGPWSLSRCAEVPFLGGSGHRRVLQQCLQGRLPASGVDRLDKEGRPQAPKEREGWLFRRRRRNTVWRPLHVESKKTWHEWTYKTERGSQTERPSLWLPAGRDS